ncbi:hypothetical protein NBRC116602_30000 [Hyphomicrobiales bacterium 4NK60-0047b]
MNGYDLSWFEHVFVDFFSAVFDIIGQQHATRLLGIKTSMRAFTLSSDDRVKEYVHGMRLRAITLILVK